MPWYKNKKIWLGLVVVILVLCSLFVVQLVQAPESEPTTVETTEVPVATSSSQTSAQPVTITSTKLAQNYFVYEKSEYEKAKAASRPIHLFFYANWCPTCAAQEPIYVQTFNNLENSNVIGFRVNYNDSDTSPDEKALAEEFGVRYQHTMFTFDSAGKQVDKFLGQTSEETLKESFAKVN